MDQRARRASSSDTLTTRRWLLVAVPLACGLAWWDAHPLVVFGASLAAVVKASPTGASLANLLVSLGVALINGGLRYGEQQIDSRRLRVSGSMLMICAFCFIVPAVFSLGTPDGTRDLSLEMSVVLVAI
jgi:Ca2+:H+ antiporter